MSESFPSGSVLTTCSFCSCGCGLNLFHDSRQTIGAESFLVDASGTIIFKQIGAMSQEVIDKEILPRLSSGGSQ